MKRLELLGVACLTCAALAWNPASAVAQRYRMTDLGVLPGQDPPHDVSHAFGINNRGQIVGESYNGTRGGGHGFIWENGVWTILPPRRSGTTLPKEINENEVVAGQADGRAVLWVKGKPIDIHGLGSGSAAEGLNENLVACGMFWFNPFQRVFPFVWRDGVMTQLKVPPPGGYDIAENLNNFDAIVGIGSGWPLLWLPPDYPPVILETLPYDYGWAQDIHDNGMIVGSLDEREGIYCGSLWEGTRLVRLLPRPGAPEFSSTAYAINARGEITVGARLFVGGGGYQSFIWREGVMMNLQDLVGFDFEKDYFNIWAAYDINDHGQIAATAAKRVNGEERGRALLLDPLDEGFAVWSITPCTAGVENVIEVVNAAPGSMVHLVFGLKREGETPVPGCADAKVEIRNPRLIGRARADANGRAEFRAFVPQQAARKTFVLQAIDRASCEVSPPAWTLFMDR